jgi:alkanesulfonate monooxygenase SsuD/methylene tetrahydromethanopterin reductase-like flavin-dependent oxidoreductase (luciferase family)
MGNNELGLVLSTATEAPPRELAAIGRLAEERGFAAVLVNEGRGDALACAQAIAAATERIQVGTNIANIYYRHPFLAAMAAATIAELSAGRLVLGLGSSHRQLLAAQGIAARSPREDLRDYVVQVKSILAGEDDNPLFPARPCPYPVPVLVAGLTVESAAVAGGVGDGLMPFLPSLDHLKTLLRAAREAAAAAGRDPAAVDCILSIPTFVSNNLDAAMSAAKHNLAFFARLPNYRRQWRLCGFTDEMDAVTTAWQSGDRRAAAACISEGMVNQVCVYGSPQMCRSQLAAFRAAGARLPLLAVSPVGNADRLGATREAIRLLAP